MSFKDQILSGLSVVEEKAKQDRIQVHMRRWGFQGSDAQFRGFSDRIGGIFSIDGFERRVFLGQQHTDERPIWPIAGGAGGVRFVTKPGRPLFSGKLRGFRSDSRFADLTMRNWFLTVELSLNPTRALLYEQKLADLSRTENKLAIPATLFAGPHPRWNGVIPLVHGDNVAIGSQRVLSQFVPTNWNINVRRYLFGVIRLLDDVLEEAASQAGGYLQYPVQMLTLQSIETYWEFPDPNPVGTIAAIERPFRSVGASSSVAWSPISESARGLFRSNGIEIGNEDNSPVVKIFPAKHTMLKAYAKATDRIRVEVRHIKGSPALGRYTHHDSAGLFDWIDKAARDGSNVVNSLFEALKATWNERPVWQHSPQRLVFDICSALKDQATALHIVELLVHHNKLEKSPESSISKPISQLLEAQIIRFTCKSGEVRIYQVSDRYRNALSHLQYAAQDK